MIRKNVSRITMNGTKKASSLIKKKKDCRSTFEKSFREQTENLISNILNRKHTSFSLRKTSLMAFFTSSTEPTATPLGTFIPYFDITSAPCPKTILDSKLEKKKSKLEMKIMKRNIESTGRKSFFLKKEENVPANIKKTKKMNNNQNS